MHKSNYATRKRKSKTTYIYYIYSRARVAGEVHRQRCVQTNQHTWSQTLPLQARLQVPAEKLGPRRRDVRLAAGKLQHDVQSRQEQQEQHWVGSERFTLI